MIYGVNILPVIVAAVLGMIVGFLWYSPMLFGKQWMEVMGLTKEKMEAAKKEMGKMYALSFFGVLMMSFILAGVISLAGSITLFGGMKVAFDLWLGFVTPVQMTEVLFGGKPWKL